MNPARPAAGTNEILNHEGPSAASGRTRRRKTTKSTKATNQEKNPGGHRLGPIFFALFVPSVVQNIILSVIRAYVALSELSGNVLQLLRVSSTDEHGSLAGNRSWAKETQKTRCGPRPQPRDYSRRDAEIGTRRVGLAPPNSLSQAPRPCVSGPGSESGNPL